MGLVMILPAAKTALFRPVKVYRIVPRSCITCCIQSRRARTISGVHRRTFVAMPKRKAGSLAVSTTPAHVEVPIPPQSKRRASRRQAPALLTETTNPDNNTDILDAADAVRASPGATSKDEEFQEQKALQGSTATQERNSRAEKDDHDSLPSLTRSGDSESDLSDLPEEIPSNAVKERTQARKAESRGPVSRPAKKLTKMDEQNLDPEAEDEFEADEQEIHEASMRPPPVNSSVLPLPWHGRLGYACLNTYLRNSNPPVFASRTCRIASILEHRHPLKFPDQPPHPTKNRPDKEQPASIERGQKYVETLGLANARDCVKMLRWNDRYGIKFLRLSSEMFPFASHNEYGYKLAPFAASTLAEVGKIAGDLGHRLTTHPGQFTQLGSPRKQVIDASIRDLEYHDELLSLLKLPPQQNRDAVMIMHLGGIFGDKEATMERFRENYGRLSDSIKRRLVLENDDVCYSVHDLLPLCEELNIPLVLDFHHHNIVFDQDKIREGTKDIVDVFPRIIQTWRKKGITPKMHYSEPTPAAITPRQRRKHSPRVATLPPCPNDMDLMIEAKDKEQAVFELMRNFRLPGFETLSDLIPHVRNDENKPPKPSRSKSSKAKQQETEDLEEKIREIPNEEVAMGGLEGRVYWPPGMEDWLRPKKRVIKKKEETTKAKSTSSSNAGKQKKKASDVKKETEDDNTAEPSIGAAAADADGQSSDVKRNKGASKRKTKMADLILPATEQEEEITKATSRKPAKGQRGRRASRKEISYAMDETD